MQHWPSRSSERTRLQDPSKNVSSFLVSLWIPHLPSLCCHSLEPVEQCPEPYSNFLLKTKLLTVAYHFSDFAYDMTSWSFLLTPHTLACCSCCNCNDWSPEDINNNTNKSTAYDAGATLPHNCLRCLTKRNTLLTPHLIYESPSFLKK